MNMIKKLLIFLLLFTLILCTLPAQEALKSLEEDYYDFLALQGLTNRPTLNYRTLSDSLWHIADDTEHLWQNQNLGKWHNLFGDFRMRVYGPELFMSGNTAAPYGQNDGVLWQGRGFNALLKGGVRFEGYGVELTILPHFSFSQNANFEILPSAYSNEYGYFWGYGVDAPQRFGDKPFFDWDFGDSEIRYSWKTLTIGFGTQAIWLGPSYLHSILHSNNAPAYPKLDIGLRRQRVTLPWLGWYLGDVEARLWVGQLTGSNYYDSGDSNKHTMFIGRAFAYAPSFLPGLSIFFNLINLVPWEWENIKYLFISDTSNTKHDDMKASLGFSWALPKVGFEVYGELGIDDYPAWPVGHSKWLSYVRNPLHTMVFTLGTKKNILISERNKIFGQLIFEWSHMEMSNDFMFQWPYSFYFHHQLKHGYTNRGQWLGNGFSPGGNAQYLEFKLFYPRGTSSFFVHRYNPDNNYIYQHAIRTTPDDYHYDLFLRGFKAEFVTGVTTYYSITKGLSIGGKLAYNLTFNPFYFNNKTDFNDEEFRHNFHVSLTVKYTF